MKPPENPITPSGLAALRARYDHLLGTERPEIVAIVSWAAGNGDRSENGDYIYGRKRMAEPAASRSAIPFVIVSSIYLSSRRAPWIA